MSQNNAARNHSNNCVASMQKNIKCSEKGSHAQMMVEVEALACHRAVEFPKEIRLSEVILEGDAEVIIQQLQSNTTGVSSYGHVIEDILMMAVELHYFSSYARAT
ncbi:hypothetical protein SO802_016190 [Lithocarpus litseifolius]|uniref:RNase H type-1 domain-containing protein n=1 Tax=Lithocarpus litseifolius TaxID=425828 RepID=A0AAW2CYB1_9ROSI